MASGTRQVVVTGVGAITPVGGDAATTWAALLAGRSGVAPLPEEWAATLPVRIAARVSAGAAGRPGGVAASPLAADGGPGPRRRPGSAGPDRGRRYDRAAAFLLTALAEAWRDAGFSGPAGQAGSPPRDRVGLCVGTGVGSAVALLTAAAEGAPPADGAPGAVVASGLPTLMLHGAATRASIVIGAGAGAHTLGSACAAGADAIAHALDMIRVGRADVVAAGGAEAVIHPLAVAAFARMSALSRRNDEPRRACRPYDKNRDGFVLGEGAGMLILESTEHAAARGAGAYCELAGAGVSADAHHLTQPEPTGRGMSQAMRAALADAGLSAADIVHVNAHATASTLGDIAESRAMAAVLGVGGYCVSATKSMTGHLMGAAGAVEAVATVLALRDRIAPPTLNVDDQDDEIEVDVVRDEPRPLPSGPAAALSNSAAFGGHNVVLAFRAPGSATAGTRTRRSRP